MSMICKDKGIKNKFENCNEKTGAKFSHPVF